ncbi:MAG: hypothetical protein ACXVQY_08345 [Actinomycetota bacterium]
MDEREIETPTHELIASAIDVGDAARAKKLLGYMLADWTRNKDYSINWIAQLLSFIGRRLGEQAVEEALRDLGERFVRPRRGSAVDARQRMEGIARAMKANGADVVLSEDDEKYVLSFRCGSGGMLIDSGAYGPPRDYLTLHQKGPVTFQRDELPVYCAHCSVNNEIQPIEWDGVPATVQHPPTKPGERCVHHIYKDQASIPDEVFARAGKTKRERP